MLLSGSESLNSTDARESGESTFSGEGRARLPRAIDGEFAEWEAQVKVASDAAGAEPVAAVTDGTAANGDGEDNDDGDKRGCCSECAAAVV